MKKVIVFSGSLLLLGLFFLGYSHPKAITFDDFIRIKRVSDPQVSPNGDLIAFVVTVMDLKGNRGNSDIWIVPVGGGEARKLTSSPKADLSPRWSPDGEKIAFVSTRRGAPQIWMISPFGGEAYPLTDISTGVSSIIWSPTGNHLAFSSSDRGIISLPRLFVYFLPSSSVLSHTFP